MKKEKWKILVSWKLSNRSKKTILENLGKRCEIYFPDNLDENFLAELIEKKKIDILIAGVCTRKMIEKGKSLKLIHSMIKSVNRIVLSLADEKIVVTNSKNYNGKSVAEFIISAMIILSRNLGKVLNKPVWKTEWSLNSEARELKDKKVCILGIGEVGYELAKLARVFGISIYGIEKDVKKIKNKKLFKFIGKPTEKNLKKVLSVSDFICVCLPKTPETINFIKRYHFSIMKPTSFLIDVSRGEIVNFEDLYQALKEKKIAGAFCDVFPVEPPDYSHPIFKLKNFYYTPHIAGVTAEAEDRQVKIIINTVNRFIDNRKNI